MKIRRNIFRILLWVVVLGEFFITSALATPVVSLNPLSLPTAVGKDFEVEVWADGDDIGLDLVAFGFDVTFAGGVFGYIGSTISSNFFDDSLISPLAVAGSSQNIIGNDDVLLAILSFTVLATGTDTLSITGLYDGEFSGLYYELDNFAWTGYDITDSLAITIDDASAAGSGEPQPIPEPSTMVLSGIAFAGFVLGRWRRSNRRRDCASHRR